MAYDVNWIHLNLCTKTNVYFKKDLSIEWENLNVYEYEKEKYNIKRGKWVKYGPMFILNFKNSNISMLVLRLYCNVIQTEWDTYWHFEKI